MTYTVLLNPNCEHKRQVRDAIDIVHQLQTYFRLTLKEEYWVPNYESNNKKVSAGRILRLVEQKYSEESVIVVIQNPFDDNCFTNEYRQLYIITLADWESCLAPPPVKVYLAYLFAGACANFAADLPEEMMLEMQHDPPIGCFFDYYKDKELIKLGMVGGNVCGDCEVLLSGMGLPDQALSSIEEILSYVRAATIRRPRVLPTRIFVGHGRSEVWLQLRTFLTKELGLQIEEFNEEPRAGIAITERLQEMLRNSCFAFLVMTAEDVHADQRPHARENVVHEIGLFQGSLGFRKTIVLKEEGVTGFSNIDGLIHISFNKGELDNKAKLRICTELERAGIIEPAIAQRVSIRLSGETVSTTSQE